MSLDWIFQSQVTENREGNCSLIIILNFGLRCRKTQDNNRKEVGFGSLMSVFRPRNKTGFVQIRIEIIGKFDHIISQEVVVCDVRANVASMNLCAFIIN